MTGVERFLKRARSRVVGDRALNWGARGLAAGALAAELAFRRFPVDPAWPVLAGCVFAGLLFGLVGWLRAWPSLPEVARLADLNLGSRERLSTALEFATAKSYLPSRQRLDAEAWAERADPRQVVPEGWPLRTLAVFLAAALFALGLWMLPNPALAQLRQHREALAAQNQAADQVATIAAKESQARPGEDPAARQALVKDLKKAEQAVRSASDPQSAVAALSQAQQDIRNLQDPNLGAKQQGSSAAGQALAQNPNPGQKAGQSLASQNNRQAAGDLRNLASSLASMSQADRQSLSQSLSQAAQAAAAGGNPQLSQSLQKASDALKNGDTAAAQAALNQAAAQTDQLQNGEDFAGDAAQAANGLQQAKTPLEQQAQAGQGSQGQGQQGQGQQGQGQGQGQGQQGQGQGQQGQGQQGQGQGQGQGQSQGQGQGQGQGQNGQGQGGQGQGGGQNGGQTAGAKSTEKVYVPSQGDPTGQGQNQGNGQGTDANLVPYEQVYADYKAAALNQVDRADIPQSERDLVNQYFANLGQ